MEFRNKIQQLINQAEKFLIDKQDNHGYWRDYLLEPGSSLAWTTAYVGYCLSFMPKSYNNFALRKAANALNDIKSDEGWGYNTQTAPDADSTAWSWRFLSKIDDCSNGLPEIMLRKYLCQDYSVQTFSCPGLFGKWASPHDEITPIVGLSLIETKSCNKLIYAIRNGILQRWHRNKTWQPFWWTDQAYVCSKNLEFLNQSGGIPDKVIEYSLRWLQNKHNQAQNTFDISHIIMCAILLKSNLVFQQSFSYLESLYLGDGSWPPSHTLVVPSQNYECTDCEVFTDINAIMSTASALLALKFAYRFVS